MGKIDLRKSSGFPIFLEDDALVSDNLTYAKSEVCNVADIKNQLLNPDITNPELFSITYSNLDQEEVFAKKGIRLDLTVVFPNLAGIEYLKSYSTVCHSRNRIIEILYGGGTIVAQSFEKADEGDIVYSNLKKGQKIIIPKGYEMSISNTKSTQLVYIQLIDKKGSVDNCLDDMGGMSYYVIRKNAKQEIVRNPQYRQAGMPRKINFEKIISSWNITSKTPIIKQILRKYEKFSWFFSNNSITI